ncbi:Metallo-hydrolase/oxidoreductase [Penicillium macrosclerotiorum]|uniref:Metallo-hydrolase/oxidoreductase n=1 Tax=Penicillium macrosclerotiorum TaxID=303699 RepID=UPI0025499653|nr:Metallo-hydrolase/oxidoreductase [Penicillium macrosclerotiorum]KAJ5689712.1 Metallo-hydrolase/oxidoreductase [Penicillium macrosclerotiorum]
MANQQFEPSFEDTTDFENAKQGFIDALDPCIIRGVDERVIWNNEEYNFLSGECPESANPKLWRQGQLTSIQGLFEVTRGVYQIRGFDLSNMTIVEGNEGVIVIDPLTTVETAAAALALYRKNRGDRKVTGVIYSHSHIDHFGGALGVLPPNENHGVPIIAPEGFMEEATSENLYAGDAMRRRAAFMYGTFLPKAPDSQIGCGLGMCVPTGVNSLIPPSLSIRQTGEERIFDGVRILFQLVPGSEAPSEMNFYFPNHKALYIAECAVHSLHNIITLRGAQVRDAKAWSQYLDESLTLYGRYSDVVFAGHGWPTWGSDKIINFIAAQRDLYAYLHDQTVRLMNHGLTGIEIAERLSLPPSLQKSWSAQSFYGSVSHNVKGIYQRYMGWFDGNPAHLWEHPPKESAKRYVACMGGIDEVVLKAKKFESEGDLRFAATLLGHATALDPNHAESQTSLASVYRKLGYATENGTWRNFYLTGARLQLPGGKMPRQKTSIELKPTQTVNQWFTLLSIHIDGCKASGEVFAIELHVTDEKEFWRLNVSNATLTYRNASKKEELFGSSGLTMKLTKRELLRVLKGEEIPGAIQSGDSQLMPKLLSLMETTKIIP